MIAPICHTTMRKCMFFIKLDQIIIYLFGYSGTLMPFDVGCNPSKSVEVKEK